MNKAGSSIFRCCSTATSKPHRRTPPVKDRYERFFRIGCLKSSKLPACETIVSRPGSAPDAPPTITLVQSIPKCRGRSRKFLDGKSEDIARIDIAEITYLKLRKNRRASPARADFGLSARAVCTKARALSFLPESSRVLASARIRIMSSTSTMTFSTRAS
jgi:hypothetical protein